MRLKTVRQRKVQAKGTVYAKALRLADLPLRVEEENAEATEKIARDTVVNRERWKDLKKAVCVPCISPRRLVSFCMDTRSLL